MKKKTQEQKKIRSKDEIMCFEDNAVYNVRETAQIIQRSEMTVRRLCRKKILSAQADHGGYFITGYRLRAFLDGQCDVVAEEG